MASTGCAQVPLNSLSGGSVSIQTDLVDQHCYCFDRRAVFQALDSKPTIAAIKEVGCDYLTVSALVPLSEKGHRFWHLRAREGGGVGVVWRGAMCSLTIADLNLHPLAELVHRGQEHQPIV